MSNDKPRAGSKTQLGHVMPQRNRAFEDTLPSGIPVTPAAKRVDSDLMTSAQVSSISATSQTSGAVTLSGARVSEPLARELIVRRMARSGISLLSDYAFSYEDLLVTLDGFDPDRRVGFQFISHAGEDVVTDFDADVEHRIRELQVQGIVHILIIHDYNAQDGDAVLARVDAFLATL